MGGTSFLDNGSVKGTPSGPLGIPRCLSWRESPAPGVGPSTDPQPATVLGGRRRGRGRGVRSAGPARVAGMPQPPTLTPEQRQAALAKAAEARRARAEIKERLKMGSITLSELLTQADSDDMVAGIKVLAVLESLPGVGKVKARRTMDEVGIADTRRLRGLGDQQRKSLLAAFS